MTLKSTVDLQLGGPQRLLGAFFFGIAVLTGRHPGIGCLFCGTIPVVQANLEGTLSGLTLCHR
jgi:hypothetical protein